MLCEDCLRGLHFLSPHLEIGGKGLRKKAIDLRNVVVHAVRLDGGIDVALHDLQPRPEALQRIHEVARRPRGVVHLRIVQERAALQVPHN